MFKWERKSIVAQLNLLLSVPQLNCTDNNYHYVTYKLNILVCKINMVELTIEARGS